MPSREEEKSLVERLQAAVSNFNSGTEDLEPLLRQAATHIENLEEERGFGRMTIDGYAEIETELVGALSRLTEYRALVARGRGRLSRACRAAARAGGGA